MFGTKKPPTAVALPPSMKPSPPPATNAPMTATQISAIEQAKRLEAMMNAHDHGIESSSKWFEAMRNQMSSALGQGFGIGTNQLIGGPLNRPFGQQMDSKTLQQIFQQSMGVKQAPPEIYEKSAPWHADVKRVHPGSRKVFEQLKALIEYDPKISVMYARASLCGVLMEVDNTANHTANHDGSLRVRVHLTRPQALTLSLTADVLAGVPAAVLREQVGCMLATALRAVVPFELECGDGSVVS